jgi:hypothetical protein
MRIVILFVNFVLITLILYSFANSKVVEGLSGCSGGNQSAIYRQQALTNRLFNEINILKEEYKELDGTRKKNTGYIALNLLKNRSAVSDINDQKKAKEKELDDLSSASPMPGAAPALTGDGGSGDFSNAIKGGPSSGRV